MKSSPQYLALDLGAESGRVMLGTLAEGRLQVEEIHRFSNGPLSVENTLRWDVLRIFEEIKTGLRIVASKKIVPTSISTDAWGVDYVYSKTGNPVSALPFHYRDTRTDGGLERAYAVVPAETIFEETGIQFLSINTLYQFLADQTHQPDAMRSARHFLTIGDFINFLLSDVPCVEESAASTTQLYNPRERAWSKKLIKAFDLPENIFPKIVPSGSVLGPLVPALQKELGWESTQVIASCSHDTGAAVTAVPAEGEDWAYLSSGTWSLLGIESPSPFISETSRKYNFTNEAGYAGTTRLLKNIVGLWIVQECRRTWQNEGQNFSYDDLAGLAAKAPACQSLIDPRDERFYKPDRMPQKIADFCSETGQVVPETPGAIIRCVYESLAQLYRVTMRQLIEITGRKIARLHVVGGGSKSDFFNQLIANAIQLPVHAGPVEATAIGNLLIQALATGQLESWPALRKVVRDSFPIKAYQPQDAAEWEAVAQRFQQLTQK